MPDLDVLRRLGDQILPPPLEVLRETARTRDRRRAVSVVIACLVALVILAATAFATVLGHDGPPQPIGPLPRPDHRPLTYADGATIHYGNRSVTADGPVVELDLTDDGVGFRTADGRIWFTDGSGADQVGTLGRPGPGFDDPWPLLRHPGWVVSANEGSRLSWFEFPSPGQPQVVVYDTAMRKEVARDPVPLEPGHTASPALVSQRFVYWYLDAGSGNEVADTRHVRYDPTTGELTRTTYRDVLDDLRRDASARTVLLGSQDCGGTCPPLEPEDGTSLQICVCGKEGIHPQGAGDATWEDVSGKPFAFDPIPGYAGENGVAWLVQWIDDHTVVVVNPLRERDDLLTCDLDTHACTVAVSASTTIVVPELGVGVHVQG